MKTEDFDDAIKRKLNSIHATYNDNEIDRVHNFVSSNKPVSFSAKYGKAMLVSAAGLVVATLVILNIIQLQKHDILVEKIDTLEKRQENLLKQIPSVENNSNTSIITDNVTKEKTESGEVKNSSQNSGIKQEEDKILTSTKTMAVSKSVEKERSQSEAQKQDIHNITQNKNNNKNNFTNQKQEKSLLSENQNGKLKPVNSKKNIDNNKLEKNPLKTDDLAKNEKEAVTNKDFSIDSSSIAVKKQAIDSINNDTTLLAIKQEKKMPGIDLQKEDHKNKKKLFPDLQFSVGLSAEKAPRMFGFGIPVQLAFSDNWSIYSGVKTSIISDVKFRDEREFRTREGKEIRSEYGTSMRDSSVIINIERTNKLIQIPVALAYNIPVKNNFSFVLSAGTDLNLASFHTLSYELMRRNNMPVVEKEIPNVKKTVPLFNNANISVGLQKRWNNITFQVNPYLMSHFRKADRKSDSKTTFIPGIGIRLMYNI